MANRIKTLLQRGFYLLYLAFFGCVTLVVTYRLFQSGSTGKPYTQFPGIYDKPLLPWIVLPGAVLLSAFLILLVKLLGRLPEAVHGKIAVLFFPVYLALQLGFALLYRVEPKGWDFEVIYRAAVGFVEGGDLYGYYFEDYPNNIAAAALLGGVFRLAKALGAGGGGYYWAGVGFNLLLIQLGVLLLYRTTKKLLGLAWASAALVFSLLFTPLITYGPIFYTDTLSFPLAAGMLYAYVLSLERKGRARLVLLLLAGLAGTAGVVLKATFAILFAAIVLHMLITEKLLAALVHAMVLAAVLAGGLQLYAMSVNRMGLLSMPYRQAGYPYTHWVMMGLKEPYGFYSYQDVLLTEAYSSKELRHQANLREIKNRLQQYDLHGMARLLAAKLLFTWGDGTYFAPVKLNREVPEYKAYHSYILPLDGSKNAAYIYYCQMFQISLLLLLLALGRPAAGGREIYSAGGRLSVYIRIGTVFVGLGDPLQIPDPHVAVSSVVRN